MDSIIGDGAPGAQDDGRPARTIEERCLLACLVCLEGHFTNDSPMGPLTAAKILTMLTGTIQKTESFNDIREDLSRSVSVWLWLSNIFAAAIPNLTARSVGPLSTLNSLDKIVTLQESKSLIVKNHARLQEDLIILIKLMQIARNLLVTSTPQVPQDICAAVKLDQMVYQTIILCVNVTGRGIDGELLGKACQDKLNAIIDYYRKFLVTALQQVHNWTAKHDRNKMSFWFDILFDDDGSNPNSTEEVHEGSIVLPVVAKSQIQHWLQYNSTMCHEAQELLDQYFKDQSNKKPWILTPTRPLVWERLPEQLEMITSNWNEDEPDLFQRDKDYGRVSRELDQWWLRARDSNLNGSVLPIPTIEFAQARVDHCIATTTRRYAFAQGGYSPQDASSRQAAKEQSAPDKQNDYLEDLFGNGEEDYDGDEDSYCYDEGSLTGLLTEVPNLLNPKQIEALHMIMRSCILDASGSGLTRVGENLQSTRCKILLALETGKNLLREILVSIAVWEQDEESLIFQLTMQIVEAIHDSALIPYIWSTLRIPKDIISPAQAILLRLVNQMLRKRLDIDGQKDGEGMEQATADGDKEANDVGLEPTLDSDDSSGGKSSDHKHARSLDNLLVHFFFGFLRSRIIPECVALMNLQAQIRDGKANASDFPVDAWDMERARDGVAQYLDFFMTAAEGTETRKLLIEWEAVYDLISILNGLEAAVPRKPLVDVTAKKNGTASQPAEQRVLELSPVILPVGNSKGQQSVESYARAAAAVTAVALTGEIPEIPHLFTWRGLKSQVITILATLLQPAPGQSSPGNAEVQSQMVRHMGIVPLLNCCAYDDHNPFAKERVTICLKWLLDGCDAANDFFHELGTRSPPLPPAPPPSPSFSWASALSRGTMALDDVGGDGRVTPKPADSLVTAAAHILEHSDQLSTVISDTTL